MGKSLRNLSSSFEVLFPLRLYRKMCKNPQTERWGIDGRHMRRLIQFLLLFVFASCSRSSSADYYRQRAWAAEDDKLETHNVRVEKRDPLPQSSAGRLERESAEDAKIVDSYSALKALERGNERFARGQAVHPHDDQARRMEVKGTQTPHTAVVSCSDSRVPPELVFDQGVGDLFVVRSAGEVLDPAGLASLEYAVEHLGVKMLLVMGHTSCGAIKTTLGLSKDKSAGSKDLDKLVAAIRPNIKNFDSTNAGKGFTKAVRAQVDGVAESLPKRSKIIQEAMEKHDLRVSRGIYDLETGTVDFW